MESSHSCNTIVFSSFDITQSEPTFLDHVFPFKWSINEIKGMFQSLFLVLSEITPLSITSIVSFSASFVHLPLVATTILHVGTVGHQFLARPSGMFS
jgi:hypothetical protein